MSGLHLHGLNYNIAEFKTWSSEKVQEFAREWGFIPTQYITKETVDEIKEFTDEIGKSGYYEGRAIEGFVIRSKNLQTEESFFFKVKYDKPYFMYREWREVTKTIISEKRPKFKYKLTQKYIDWVKDKLRTEPEIFKEYKKNHGIFKVREMFLDELKLTTVETLGSDELVK